jgi:GT2 family glycosyltransferase
MQLAFKEAKLLSSASRRSRSDLFRSQDCLHSRRTFETRHIVCVTSFITYLVIAHTLSSLIMVPGQEGVCDVDIVVTVHNSLKAVIQLLLSLERNTWIAEGTNAAGCANVYLVNAGSDPVTTAFLERKTIQKHVGLTYVLIDSTLSSYTKAANLGITSGSAKTVILLNSDVILPRRWMHHFTFALSVDPSVAMSGPLSNSACYQSIPKVAPGHWSKNLLPDHLDIEKVNKFIRSERTPEFPRAPLINGFAMAFKRSIFADVGYFNESAFPVGYGEENDFCMRVRSAGFVIVIADNLYLHHQKSASFGEFRRRELIASANTMYSADLLKYISAAYRELLDMPALIQLRNDTSRLFSRD